MAAFICLGTHCAYLYCLLWCKVTVSWNAFLLAPLISLETSWHFFTQLCLQLLGLFINAWMALAAKSIRRKTSRTSSLGLETLLFCVALMPAPLSVYPTSFACTKMHKFWPGYKCASAIASCSYKTTYKVYRPKITPDSAGSHHAARATNRFPCIRFEKVDH